MEDERKKDEEKKEQEDNTGNEKEEEFDPIPYDRFKEVNDERKELADKLKKMEEKDSKTDEYKTKLEKMQNQLKEKDINTSLTLTALQEGIREDALEDFMKLVDKSQVEVNEEGVQGVEELVKDFKDKKSFLFKNSGTDKAGSEFKGNNDYSTDNIDSIKRLMGLK